MPRVRAIPLHALAAPHPWRHSFGAVGPGEGREKGVAVMTDAVRESLADRSDALARAAEALLRRLEVIEQALRTVYSSAYAHGVEYTGPTYGTEREALSQALRAYQQARQSGEQS